MGSSATQPRIRDFPSGHSGCPPQETGGGSAWRAFSESCAGSVTSRDKISASNAIPLKGIMSTLCGFGARDIVARNPDLIVTGTNPVVIAFKAATSAIPVVAFMADPLKAGLVTSLARPGATLRASPMPGSISGESAWSY
jgi:putative ABC transport system substrate-binding protein